MPSTFSLAYRTDRIKYLTDPELSTLLSVIKQISIRDYAIFQTAYSHALRVSEVGMLTLQDWNEDTKRISVHRVKSGRTKTNSVSGKIEAIRLTTSYLTSPETQKAMRTWLRIRIPIVGGESVDATGAIFLSRFRLPISRKMLDHLMRKYAIKAKLPKDKQHFHVLRHTCAVQMVDKGIPMRQIQDWLGHRNLQSTEIYAKVSDKARDETARLFYESLESKKGLGLVKNARIDWKKDKR